MFLNISHENSGRSGQSGDVIGCGCISLPTYLHSSPCGRSNDHAHCEGESAEMYNRI